MAVVLPLCLTHDPSDQVWEKAGPRAESGPFAYFIGPEKSRMEFFKSLLCDFVEINNISVLSVHINNREYYNFEQP